MSRLLTSLQRIASQGPLADEPPVVVPQANVDLPAAHAATTPSETTPGSTLARLNALQELMAAEWSGLPGTPVPAPLLAAVEIAATSSIANPITATLKPSVPDANASSVTIANEHAAAARAQELSWQKFTSVETVAPDRQQLAESLLVEAVETINATLSGFWNVEPSPSPYPFSLPDTTGIDDSIRTDIAAPPPQPATRPQRLPEVRRPALLKVRDEYSQFRDHLLSQFSLPLPCTILLIDTGAPQDSAWLLPLAVSFWQYLVASLDTSDKTIAPHDSSRVLIVESAGSNVAESLGLHSRSGLTDVLLDREELFSAIQPTPHPSIDLLTGGDSHLSSNMAAGLTGVWQELQKHYDIVLVAGGPWHRAEEGRGCDPASLIGLAQAVLLCVDVNSSPRVAALQAADDLRQRGANLLGCVVRN